MRGSTIGSCARSSRNCRAREEFAKRELERVTELIGRGAATMQAHERISMDLRQVQALISVQMEKLAYYTITAPMDGVVLRRDGEVGEIAEAGQVLFRVGVPKPLQIVAEVNEEDIPRVAVGQNRIAAHRCVPGPARSRARVSEITPMGDPVAKTYRIRIAPARRHAAHSRHERRGQRGNAREGRARCSFRPMRCRARRVFVIDGRAR